MFIKVSIIIPAYNVEKYIKKCVNSVINQTLEDIEIIVVNDGSTDNTLQLLNKLQALDKRIVILNKENGGLSSARNAGLRIAKGEYIQHLDGDDWLEKESCQETYAFAKENNLDIVILDYFSDDNEGNIHIIKDDTVKNKILNSDEYLYYLFRGYSEVSVCTKLIKRNLYKNIEHPENISLGEDLATTPRLVLNANRIAKYDKAYLHYIVNMDSITREKFSIKMYQLFIVFEIIRKAFKEVNKLEFYSKQITELEMLRINAFLVMTPYWDDYNYNKSIELILNFLKNNPVVPQQLKGMKKIILKFLVYHPTKNNLKFLIILSNILSRIKKRTLI